MIIKTSEFVISNTDYKKCPEPDMPEFAFIGRSNVGKSSLINMLVSRKNLAKTSSTPGKTQLINHFLINGSWYLVDLPGYGYARVSQRSRESWGNMVNQYLLNRENLMTVFVLIDSRHSPQSIDLEFVNYLGEKAIPFQIVFTKADKQSERKTLENIDLFKEALYQTWEELPKIHITSSVKRTGREEVLEEIGLIIPYFNSLA